MSERNKGSYILILTVIMSTLSLGLITFFVYPFIEKNKELMGTYYTLTTMLSIIIGIISDKIINYFFEKNKAADARKVSESDPTDEFSHVKRSIEINNRNKAAKDYEDRYGKI